MQSLILPGFDTDSALKLLNNNEKLYTNVLKRFHAQYTKDFDALSSTILEGEDWPTIQREAHTIKGLAGTIGHPALQQAALGLELTIKDVNPVDPAQVKEKGRAFLGLFSDVLEQLGQALPE